MTYQILEDGITINVSDEIFVFPDKKTPTPDDDGVISYYELLNSKDSKNIFWREKLGEGMKTSFKDATFPKAILTDFPKGYKLYAHRKKHPKKGERTDYYLFGRHKFRSANEFLPHLLWLISNKSGQCHCKYCIKSTTITSGRKVSVPSAKKAKKQKNVDTSNEATIPKRITRSNAEKVAGYRKKSTDNRRKNTRRSSTKKRKSKSVELEKNLPPPVPKYSVFRGGEIVWLDIKEVLNDKTLAECNKIFSIKHWPAIVGSVTPQGDESVIYTVKPLILNGNKNVTIDSLRPWLIRNLDEALGGNKRITRSLLNINLDEASPEQIVEIYFKAIQKASEIVKVFTPMYQYDYHKKGSRKKHHEHHGVHYKAIYFGAELIYEDDLVRLLPEEPKDQSGPIDDNDQNKETKETYLQITSIFEDSKKNIHITGDLYERGKLLEKGEYEWIPKNDQDEEYTIGVEDIAGRLYPMFSDITESFVCELLKTFENRMLMLGDDVPPIIITLPNTTTPREPDTPNKHETATTPIIRKQTAKRTSPLPPISTESSVLIGKRPSPFSLPQKEGQKKARKDLEIEIEKIERRETNIEISEKEITIKQTSDIKSIEKVGSPIKFSDIERKYTKKSEDIDLPPLVVSPDTPTFETDDDISEGNNGDKKI